MIDYGLLFSLIIGFGLPSMVATRWPLNSFAEPTGFLDATLGAAFAGLAVGRLTALALDDPGSIGSVSDMIIIRSGVEFWPGVAAALLTAVWIARRADVPPLRRLGDLTPCAMLGYAGYEMACVFRDGCFGPLSAVGLRPPGLTATMLPIGLLMAAAVVVAAVGLHWLAARDAPPGAVVVAGLLAVASIRSVGSIWLPHVGEGLTRQHVTSIALTGVLAGWCVVIALRHRRFASRLSADDHERVCANEL